ncbi:MAG: cytochrome C oxidase Cbb3, partial [Proteobacteria bacterium]|nr:cytochrome C oxidase Cbb3 [Pseudomonadota bacterium]
VLIWLGMWVMAWNLWFTASHARQSMISPIPVPIPDPERRQTPEPLPVSG